MFQHRCMYCSLESWTCASLEFTDAEDQLTQTSLERTFWTANSS